MTVILDSNEGSNFFSYICTNKALRFNVTREVDEDGYFIGYILEDEASGEEAVFEDFQSMRDYLRSIDEE